MKFKLDENLPVDAADLLSAAGHDVHTVYQEGLCGEPDSKIADICQAEARILITLDTDFCSIVNYPPERYSGIIVIRLMDQSRPAVLQVIQDMIAPYLREDIAGKLWIVQKDGIRVR
jgi:predicted nuclease of predicted toxin-antitoxin system